MKNPKRLKLKHKKFLSEQGERWRDFLFVEEGPDYYKFFHRETEKVVDMRR